MWPVVLDGPLAGTGASGSGARGPGAAFAAKATEGGDGRFRVEPTLTLLSDS